MTLLKDGEPPYKREHIGSEDPVPSDPVAFIEFMVSTGNTFEEQKEWMEFVSDALRSGGSHPPSATEIRKQWEAGRIEREAGRIERWAEKMKIELIAMEQKGT